MSFNLSSHENFEENNSINMSTLDDNSPSNEMDQTEATGNHISKLALGLKSLLQQYMIKRTRKFRDINDVLLREKKMDENHSDLQSRKKQRTDVDETTVYETSVVKYRRLRNEIPLLTDAAYDIDASTAALNERRNDLDEPLLGPLVRRAPPGRGRRKTLSVINTPLPAALLETLNRQKRTTKFDPFNLVFPRPFRILFVDDSLITLRLTARRLQNAGFWIETTTNGEEALALITGNNQYDIVLTDLNMPIMSGVEVSHYFKFYHYC